MERSDAARLPGPAYYGRVLVDSLQAQATVMDLYPAHLAAADVPLTFHTGDWRVGIPEVFATTEYVRWLFEEVHEKLDKFAFANWVLRELPWGASYLDAFGTEID